MQFCAACGQALVDIDDDTKPKLSVSETQLYEIVKRAGPGGISIEALFERLYLNDPEGGPLSGTKVLHVRVHAINKKLRRYGYQIKGTYGPGSTYSLKRRMKGKTKKGDRLLTAAIVATIRQLYADRKFNQVQLAKKYRVTQGHISVIVRGKAWELGCK